jgi:hypothetical protein
MEKNQVVENCHSTFPSSIKIFNKNFSPKQKVPPLTAPPWMAVSKIINKFCNLHQNLFTDRKKMPTWWMGVTKNLVNLLKSFIEEITSFKKSSTSS